MTVSAPRASVASLVAAGDRLGRRLRERARDLPPGRLIAMAEAVPRADPLALFAAADGERAFWRQPADALALTAVGRAAAVGEEGDGAIPATRAAWRALIADASADAPPDLPLRLPLAVGGFAFDAARPADPVWQGLPRASLVFPALALVVAEDRAWLVVQAVVGRAIDPAALAAVGRLSAAATATTAAAVPLPTILRVTDLPDRTAWRAAVEDTVAVIRTGALRKLVLARSRRLEAAGAWDAAAVLTRLGPRFPDAIHFAFSRGAAAFLGATPEQLIALRHGEIRTAAIAGSAPRAADPDTDAALGRALLADAKEQQEHACVVDALRAGLAPVVTRLDVAPEPALLRLPHVHHLCTPVRATPRPGQDVLDLVARLHPTPAVGGLPVADSLARLRSLEPFGRGWYAGPVGWVDAAGEGEFAVAIRSALLRGTTADLFAGCGIMAASDPEREYEESCWKFRAMEEALGGDA